MNAREKYSDIIDLPAFEPKLHARMPREARAAQFAPFSALVGFEDLVVETARLTEKRTELTEEEKTVLNEKLEVLLVLRENEPQSAITYFVKDSRKDGGAYLTKVGVVMLVDQYKHVVKMTDGTEIPIDDIVGIDSAVLYE